MERGTTSFLWFKERVPAEKLIVEVSMLLRSEQILFHFLLFWEIIYQAQKFHLHKLKNDTGKHTVYTACTAHTVNLIRKQIRLIHTCANVLFISLLFAIKIRWYFPDFVAHLFWSVDIVDILEDLKQNQRKFRVYVLFDFKYLFCVLY